MKSIASCSTICLAFWRAGVQYWLARAFDDKPCRISRTGKLEGTRRLRMHYLLFYEVGEDYVSRRAEFRDAHLEKAWAASARGELVLGGALENPVDGAVL